MNKSEALSIKDKKRTEALEEADKKRKELHRLFPRIALIDKKIVSIPFRLMGGASPEELGERAAKYMKLLNNAISAHFELYPDINASAAYVSKIYGDYICKNTNTI